jgi:predicted ABC-type ATPase
MPTLYILAGCNGAGKTTAAQTLLPHLFKCDEFVNADLIARGISPFHPESVAIQSGKIMLDRINYLVSQQKTFAIETTLSSKNYVSFIKKCRANNYKIELFYFWLNSYKMAISRVEQRVLEGGHNIPTIDIKRRYLRGIKNLNELYIKLSDTWIVFDNSNKYEPTIIATGELGNNEKIFNFDIWSQITTF